MFLDNKYSKVYFSLIDRAKQRTPAGYVERHHIIPKCMGGSDREDNLVALTAREHYVCHILLPHMVSSTVDKSKLYHACGMIVRGNKHGRIYTSRQYETARMYHARGNTLRQTGKKMSLTHEERERRATAMIFARAQRSYSPLSKEVKQAISQARQGQSPHNKGQPANKLVCEHCNKTVGGESNFARWHGDNCKLNPQRKADTRKELSAKLKGRPKPKYECNKCNKMIGGHNNLVRHQSSCSGS